MPLSLSTASGDINERPFTNCVDRTVYRLVGQPFVRYDDLRMCLEPRLDSPSLPLPEDYVALPVTAADPLPVW